MTAISKSSDAGAMKVAPRTPGAGIQIFTEAVVLALFKVAARF
jgi:hypothetical protein